MPISGQIVDTETAHEFMAQTLEKVTRAELGDITGELERKSRRFQEMLAPDRLTTLSEQDLHGVLRHVFATRRSARSIIDGTGVELFRKELFPLLYGSGPLPVRFETFVDVLGGFDAEGVRKAQIPLEIAENVRCDLASELLHFVRPEECWLWTRWMWDPRVGTGALPLVVDDEYSLMGASPGEIYTKVGVAIAFVKATGDAAGFARLGHAVFDIDVFLACVYAVYMYTTLRLRMTQEFNKVVPKLPELVRRLLGVWRFDL